jgi:hypothetical protein
VKLFADFKKSPDAFSRLSLALDLGYPLGLPESPEARAQLPEDLKIRMGLSIKSRLLTEH